MQAVSDWSGSDVLNMVEDMSGSTSKKVRRKCNSPDGMVRICNNTYGATGWLGIAGISIDTNNHITKGYTKLNDTYFNTAYYDTYPWKQSVICQEIGHNVSLDHQGEEFTNESLLSCMDYQDPPYEYPNPTTTKSSKRSTATTTTAMTPTRAAEAVILPMVVEAPAMLRLERGATRPGWDGATPRSDGGVRWVVDRITRRSSASTRMEPVTSRT